MADGGLPHMAGIHHRIIRKGQKLLPDRTDQIRSTAVDKIRPSHRILEQGIPADQHLLLRDPEERQELKAVPLVENKHEGRDVRHVREIKPAPAANAEAGFFLSKYFSRRISLHQKNLYLCKML